MKGDKLLLKLLTHSLSNSVITTKGTYFDVKSKVDHEAIFYSLKTKYEFEDLVYVVDNIPNRFQKFLYGNPFPKSIEELGQSVFVGYSQLLIDEINWFLILVRKYHYEINKFIELKYNFDKLILLGNYFEAEKVLDQIDHEICCSVWSIENRLLVREMSGGVDANKTYLTKVNEKKSGHFLILLADFFSKKAENDFLINRYNTEVKNLFNTESNVLDSETVEYYYFKVNLYEKNEYNYLSFINAIDFQNSIIDRYLTCIKSLQIVASEGYFNQIDSLKLKTRISYLSSKINDPVINNIKQIIDLDFVKTPSKNDKEGIAILDYYTKGEYLKVVEKTKQLILRSPFLFEFYVIYCKSLINLNFVYDDIGDPKSFQNKILIEVYNLLKKATNPLNHASNLKKISNQLSSLNISAQIIDFALSESQNNQRFNNLSLISSVFLNPDFYKVFNSEENAQAFLENLKLVYSVNSITLDFLFYKKQNNLDERILDLSVANNRVQFYVALSYQNKEEYSKAVELWNSLLSENENKPHVYVQIINNLYYCCLKLDNINQCVKIFVNAFFKNQFYTQKLDSSLVLHKIRQARFRGIQINIDLPIFFSLTCAEETKVSAACEKFLEVNYVRQPSDLIEKIKLNEYSQDKDKIIFFFDKVCSIDLFKHIVYIKTTKGKLNERLKIVDFLLEFDVENYSDHLDEREEINRQIFIQEGLQEYDESKIFINEQMIRSSLLNDLQLDFQRFRNISKIGTNLIVYDITTESVHSLSLNGNRDSINEPIFSSNPLLDIFKDMFMEVRNHFLDSQYGLGEYLSARIRHGVFKSEIRPKFEKLKLITEKDASTNVYKRNFYWDEKMQSYPENIKNEFQIYLATFSNQIDSVIEEEGLKRYLQIKTENKNKEGWFDYEFSKLELSAFFAVLNNENSFSNFIDGVFKFLWERTDKNLENIRRKMNTEYKEKFEDIILSLEQGLTSLVNKNSLPEVFENIATSKVNIQNDLGRIGRWFNRIGKKIKEFSINKVVEISVEHINKRYDEKEIRLQKDIDCDLLFKGEFCPFL